MGSDQVSGSLLHAGKIGTAVLQGKDEAVFLGHGPAFHRPVDVRFPGREKRMKAGADLLGHGANAFGKGNFMA